jgi:hypothetical protein
MTTIFLLTALLALVAGLGATVHHDGRGPSRPPRSHEVDLRFLPPYAR